MIIKRMVALCMLSATLIHLPAYALQSEKDIAQASKEDLTETIPFMAKKSIFLLNKVTEYVGPEKSQAYVESWESSKNASDQFEKSKQESISNVRDAAQQVVTSLKASLRMLEEVLPSLKADEKDMWWMNELPEFLKQCREDIVAAHEDKKRIASVLYNFRIAEMERVIIKMLLANEALNYAGVEIALDDKQKDELAQCVASVKAPCCLAQVIATIKKFNVIETDILEKIRLSEDQLKAIKQKAIAEIEQARAQGALNPIELKELEIIEKYVADMSLEETPIVNILGASLYIQKVFLKKQLPLLSTQTSTASDQKKSDASNNSHASFMHSVLSTAKSYWYVAAVPCIAFGAYKLYAYMHADQENEPEQARKTDHAPSITKCG